MVVDVVNIPEYKCRTCGFTKNPRGWEICSSCGSKNENQELHKLSEDKLQSNSNSDVTSINRESDTISLERISDLEQKLCEFDQKYSHLESEKKKIEEELEKTRNTLTDSANLIETHSRKISNLKQELRNLDQKYSDLESEKKKIEEELEKTRNTLTDSANLIETHSRKISNLKQELRNLDQKYSDLESEKKKHENEADTLKIKNRNLTNILSMITPLLALLLVASLWSIYISKSEEINSLKSRTKSLEKNIKDLKNKVFYLNIDVNTWKDKFDKLVAQTESQILPNNSIVYDGKLSSLQKTNTHIFWVTQKNQYFFNLYDLSGGDADFVITDENGTEISDTKKTSAGGDSLSFEFDRGTYYVKVYLYGQNDVSYKLSIYRY